MLDDIQGVISSVGEDGTVKKLKKEGFFLISCSAFLPKDDALKQWNVSYYNPVAKKIARFSTDGKSVKAEPIDDFESAAGELDPKKVLMSYANALGIAAKTFSELGYQKLQTIVTVTMAERAVWKITFITNVLGMVSVTIGAADGKVIGTAFDSLIKK